MAKNKIDTQSMLKVFDERITEKQGEVEALRAAKSETAKLFGIGTSVDVAPRARRHSAASAPITTTGTGKKRGRPTGSKNKPKNAEPENSKPVENATA